jgi:hypothetical protein
VAYGHKQPSPRFMLLRSQTWEFHSHIRPAEKSPAPLFCLQKSVATKSCVEICRLSNRWKAEFCAALTTYKANITAQRPAFRSMGGPRSQDEQRSSFRWIPFTGGVDSSLLPRPMMSVVASKDPLLTARLPHIPRFVTDWLECCCGARVWLQGWLYRVVTDYL